MNNANIDEFYKALNNIIQNDNDKNNEKCCLISNEPLIKPHITLICNHSFNYNDIFYEIKNQKKNGSSSYNEITRLKIFQIKCPYCRNVQDGLLPYFKHLDLPKIKGVNSPDRFIYKPDKCSYIFKSGKKKNTCCNKPCYKKYCNAHKIIMERKNKKNGQKSHNTVLKSNIIKLSKENKGSCCHSMLSGKRKGEWCGSVALYSVDSKKYCKTHAKKYGTFHTTPPVNTIIPHTNSNEFDEWLHNNVMP